MPRPTTSRAERDQFAALRASEEARATKFRKLADEAAQPRRCIHCGAAAPAVLAEGEAPPCGCP